MAVAYSSNGGGANAAGSGGNYSVTTTYPATINAGDLLIAFVGAIASTSVDTLATAAGWTAITSVGVGGGQGLAAFWKIAAGTEGGTTVAFTGTYTGATLPTISAIIERYTGAAASGTPVESAATNTGNSSTPAPASVTTSAANGMAVFHVQNATNRSSGNITGETGGDYTEAYADYLPGSGTPAHETQTAALASAGTISGGTCTLSASTPWRVICFGIKNLTAVATSVTLSAASYAFTGSSLTSATGRKATLSASSYAFTGQALSAKSGRKQVLSSASFAYTGQSLTAQWGRKAVLSAASYSFTGSSLTAKTGRVATLTKAAYAFSGNALTTNYGRSVTLTGATCAYTGASLTNLLSRKATLSPASLAFTGQSLVANYGRKVVLTGASFTFNGQVLGVVTGRKAVVSAAAFAYTGQSLLAKTGRKVTLNAASLAFTGQSLTVVYTPISGVYTVTLSPAAFAYAGQGLSTKAGRKSALSPGSLAFSGQSLTAAYAPGATATNYAVTLSAATFGFTGQSLTAESSVAFLQPLVGGDDAWPLSDRKERKWKPAYPHLREEIQGTLDRLRGRIKAPPAEAPEAIKAAAVVSKYLDEPIDWDALLRTRSHLRRLETALIAYQAWAQAQEDDDLLLLLAA